MLHNGKMEMSNTDNSQMVMKSGTVEANNITTGPSETNVMIQDYENIFGPAARDIKHDSQRNKRHQRWHLPDALKGALLSPHASLLLPYACRWVWTDSVCVWQATTSISQIGSTA